MPTTLVAAGLKSLAPRDSALAHAVDQLPAMPTNINDMERVVSAALGVSLLALPAGGLGGLVAKFAGGALVLRGATGHCMGYQLLGMNSSEKPGSDYGRFGGPEKPGALAGTHPVGYRATTSVPHDSGVRVEEEVTVRRTPQEVYSFWRNYANLPKFQGQIEEVRDLGGVKSHWVGRAPVGGLRLEWDAELINDEPGRLIAWRSVPGADVGTAGAVHFDPAPGGCRVRVNCKFDLPGGKLAAAVAGWLGKDPASQTRDDLQRLKGLLEGGR